jgi:hypothetical protein
LGIDLAYGGMPSKIISLYFLLLNRIAWSTPSDDEELEKASLDLSRLHCDIDIDCTFLLQLRSVTICRSSFRMRRLCDASTAQSFWYRTNAPCSHHLFRTLLPISPQL